MNNSNSQDGDMTVMEGLPGLFNASDTGMRFVFISGIPEVQAVMAGIPFIAIGVTSIAFAVVLVLVGRLTRSLLHLILAGGSAFTGAVFSLSNVIIGEWHEDTNFALTIATSVVLAFTVVFTAWYLFRRAEQPGPQEQLPNNAPPPLITRINDRSSWSSDSSDRRNYHSGQWRRCGFTGTLLRALLYMNVAVILGTEITWRVAFNINAEPFFAVYYVSAGLQLFFIAAISLHLVVSCFSKRQPTRASTNLAYISPILFGNAVGVAISVLALIMVNFTETPLGRLLSAIRLFAYITNALIDELRTPRPDGFTAELFPRSIAGIERFSQGMFPQQQQQESSEKRFSARRPFSPVSDISGPLDLQSSSPPKRRDSVVKSWASFPNTIDDSVNGVVVQGSAVAESDGDSPLDVDLSVADADDRRRKSMYRVNRPSSIRLDPSRERMSVVQRSAEPLTSATLPSYRSDSRTAPRENSNSPVAPLQPSLAATVRPGPGAGLGRLSPIRQASHESSFTADQSVYSNTQHYSTVSHSTNSTANMSDFEAQNFPLPPDSAVGGDRQSRMIPPPNSVLVDQEQFVFEPPRAGRFDQNPRASDLTLGSAGSIGESLPESRPSTPTQRAAGTDKNITSFIAPCSGNEAAPFAPRPAAQSSRRTSSMYSGLSDAQILRAQTVISNSYARYGQGSQQR